MKLTNWKIVRSGAGMTITGTNAETGADTKLTEVHTVEAAEGHAVATDLQGASHELLIPPTEHEE